MSVGVETNRTLRDDEMRAIGELCRDVIARSELMAIMRGSFSPRIFAVVFFRGCDVGFVRFNLGLKVAEEDAMRADANGGLVVSSIHAKLSSLEAARSLRPGIEAILLMSDGAKIDNPIVRPVAIDMIDEAVRVRAVVQEPGDAVTLQYATLEHDGDVLAGADVAAQRAWLKLFGLVAANAGEYAGLSIESEIATNLGRR